MDRNVSSVVLLVLCAFVKFVELGPSVVVLLPKGKIEGRIGLKTRGGRIITSFTGIPYAEPPVNTLRLKDPIPKQPWTDVIKATVNSPQCPQKDVISINPKPDIIGQEDCLFLNIYTPEVIIEPKYPVMVYIYGGSYLQGSNQPYGPEFLLDKDIVLVTINYRLAVLGFLSLGDDVLPGNLGLKDQALALQWINENIKFFGGNPDMVTIFGDSAGGASVNLHMFSNLSKGLFHRAISMSGTALCPWAVIPRALARDRSKAFVTLVGCPTEPSTAVLKCLQATPLDIILKNQQKFYEWLFSPVTVFGPVVEGANEGAFLTSNPRTDQPISAVPWITGISSGEGGVVASGILGRGPELVHELQTNYERIFPFLLTFRGKYLRERLPLISEEIKQFYFGAHKIDNSTVQPLIDMMTDNWFMYGGKKSAAKWSFPTYFYYYDFLSTKSFNEIFGDGSIKSVSHSDILLNLFPLSAIFPERVLTEEEKNMSRKIINLWTEFASGLFWKGTTEYDWIPIKPDLPSNYFHITKSKPIMRENLLHDRYQFWRALEEMEGGEMAVII